MATRNRKQRGSLYQRGHSPNWYGKFRARGGKVRRVSLKTTDRDEARAALDALVAAQATPAAPKPAAPKPAAPKPAASKPAASVATFEAVANEWLAIYQSQGISAGRKRTAEVVRGRFVAAMGGAPIASVGEIAINQYLNGRLGEAAYSTVAEERMYLSAIFKVAIRKGLVNYNPVEDYRFPRGANRKEDKRRHLTLDEFRAVLARVPSEVDRAALSLFFATGARKGELQGAKFSDVIINGDGIVKLRIRGENNKTRKDRLIPLSESTRELIELLRRDSGGEYILPRVHSEYWRIVLKTAQRNAGIDDAISLHGLRHSFCSHWANRPDVPLAMVRDWAGHSDLTTTAGYVHVDESAANQLMATFKI